MIQPPDLADPAERARYIAELRQVYAAVWGEDLHAGSVAALAAHPQAKVHLYGKDVRPGRKVGHVNVVADHGLSLEEAVRTAESAAALLRDDAPTTGTETEARP